MSEDARTNLLQDTDALWSRRLHADLTQEDLASKALVDQSHISLLERGKRNATVPTLAAIAEALGCPAADLVSLQAHHYAYLRRHGTGPSDAAREVGLDEASPSRERFELWYQATLAGDQSPAGAA